MSDPVTRGFQWVNYDVFPIVFIEVKKKSNQDLQYNQDNVVETILGLFEKNNKIKNIFLWWIWTHTTSAFVKELFELFCSQSPQ